MHDDVLAPFTAATPDAPDGPAEPGPLPALFGQCAWFRALAPEHQARVLAHAHAE